MATEGIAMIFSGLDQQQATYLAGLRLALSSIKQRAGGGRGSVLDRLTISSKPVDECR
jgi:hypothetical protein